MKKTALFLLLNLMLIAAFAQSIENTTKDLKMGLGLSHLGTGDVLIGKIESELTRKWNRIISNSGLIGIGYGDLAIEYYQAKNIDNHRTVQPSFIAQADGNVFVSPFGNDRKYNLKLGTGLSFMFVRDRQLRNGSVLNWVVERRVSLGYNMILENEFAIAKRSLLGLKLMLQPYFNGDINMSLMAKVGTKF